MFALINQNGSDHFYQIKFWRLKLALCIVFVMMICLSLRAVELYGKSVDRLRQTDFTSLETRFKGHISRGDEWLSLNVYRKMIEKHNHYLPELARWRKLFAAHAPELARLLKSFPGGEKLSEDALQKIISNPEAFYNSFGEKDVFAPWTNRWKGIWSNGKMQYHLWDSTRYMKGRWIQPVTISEVRFAELNQVEEMADSRVADVAINVFSPRYGITGWVSKCQQGRVEMPHIGYRVNDTTLVWITQEKQPGKLFAPNNCWFVFLESVDRSVQPEVYRIYGQPILMEETVFEEPGQRDIHFATYYAKHTGNS